MTTRLYVEAGDIRVIRANLLSQKIPFILGNSTVYVMRYKSKFLDKKACFKWPDDTRTPLLMTRGEAAKTELEREFPNIKRVGWWGSDIGLMDKRPPMHFGGAGHFDGFYVDLKAAYHTLYSKLTLDVRYPRGIGNKPLWLLAKRVKDDKRVRNAIIGVVTGRYVSMGTKEGKVIQVKSRNKFLSPPLWATLQDILNDIATLAYNMGAFYINTDGYIFKDRAGAEFAELLKSLGLQVHYYQAEIDIRNWGSYKIGNVKTTEIYKRGMLPVTNPIIWSDIDHSEGRTLAWWASLPTPK